VDGQLVAQVIGVTPPGFFGLAVGESFDVAGPDCPPKELLRQEFDISVMGRLRPGWTLERASAQLQAVSPGIFEATAPTGYSAKSVEDFKHFRLGAYPAGAGVSSLRENYDTSLWMLLAITGLVLLIACANLANLMLARASAREREVAVRLALGAGRARLLRQLLVEGALLAVLGTALGIVLARALSRALVWSLSTQSNSVDLTLATDWRVLVFAILLAGLTCLVFAVVPAFRATAAEPMSAMKVGGRGLTTSRERFSLQRLMVVVQISVSVVLLAGALLFVRSFRNLMTLDPGMREAGVTIAFIGFHQAHISPDHYAEFKRNLVDSVRSTPGILNAATTTNIPLLGASWTHGIRIGTKEGSSKFAWVSPSYFETMGIPLRSGRGFNERDTAASPHVVVVNQAFVNEFTGGQNPIGRTLRTSPEPDYPATMYEIVGTIPDTKYNDVRTSTPPMAFAPAPQMPATAQRPWTAIMIYSHANTRTVADEVRQRVSKEHPGINMDFADFQLMIRDGMVRERLMALLSGFFGLLAAILAMIGLYGVISYIVARRQREIGIRLALGAYRGQVVSLIMREAGWLLAIGVVTGTALALFAGRGATSLLFGLKPYDPPTLIAAVAALVFIAALASFVPAQRASRLDPMMALRCE
jgi:predicted permease